MYKENITVYQLVGLRLRMYPNFSDVTLNSATATNYTWTVDDLGKVSTYKWLGRARVSRTMFFRYYRYLMTPFVITKSNDLLIWYTAQRSNSGKFYSGTAILRVGGKSSSTTIQINEIMKTPG